MKNRKEPPGDILFIRSRSSFELCSEFLVTILKVFSLRVFFVFVENFKFFFVDARKERLKTPALILWA